MTPPAQGRPAAQRPLAPLRHPFLVLAAVLGVASLGLPWGVTVASGGGGLGHRTSWHDLAGPDGVVPIPVAEPLFVQDSAVTRVFVGAEHPVRVIALAAAVLLITAVRQGLPGRARLAVAVGALALPLDLSGGLTSGRAVYALALLLAAVASGVLPRPGASGRSGPPGGARPGATIPGSVTTPPDSADGRRSSAL